MKLSKYTLFSLLVSLALSLCFERPVMADSPDGGEAAAFLKTGVGARALGMGSAQSAVADDAYAIIYNPAGLAQLDGWQVGSQTGFLPLGRVENFLSFVLPVKTKVPFDFGISWTQFLWLDPIEVRTKNTPTPDSTFNASDDAFHFSMAAWVIGHQLAVGGNLKIVEDLLGDSNSFGAGTDLGLLYLPIPEWKISLVCQDIYTNLTWNTGYNEAVPQTFVLGSAYQKKDSFLVSAELQKDIAQDLRWRLGAELTVLPKLAVLRLGLNDGAFGAGLGLQSTFFQNYWVSLDYSLSTDPTQAYAFTGFQHRVSLSIGFEPPAPPAGNAAEQNSQETIENEGFFY